MLQAGYFFICSIEIVVACTVLGCLSWLRLFKCKECFQSKLIFARLPSENVHWRIYNVLMFQFAVMFPAITEIVCHSGKFPNCYRKWLLYTGERRYYSSLKNVGMIRMNMLIVSVSRQLRNVRCDHFCRLDNQPLKTGHERAAEIEPIISGIRSLNRTIKLNTTIKTTSCGHQTI